MRIVVDARMLGWTGIGRYTRHLLDELGALDPNNEYVALVAPDGAGGPGAWRPGAPNVDRQVADVRPYSIDEQRRLAGILGSLRPDLVHFTHFNVPLAYRGPFVVTVHDLTMLRFRNIGGGSPAKHLGSALKYAVLHRAMASAVRRARGVLVPSAYVAGDLARTLGCPADKVTVTYEAVDAPQGDPLPVPALADGRPYLLYVGNFYPHKNLTLLVEAMAVLARTHPALRLVLAGTPSHFQRQLAERVGAGPLADRVVLTGYVDDPTLEWLYRQATVFVFPSLSEGFGLPGLEAMARGLPVAAARATALPEVYGDAAVYFDPHDAGDAAATLAGLVDDPARRAALARAGAARASTFSWRRMAELTLACYETAGGAGR